MTLGDTHIYKEHTEKIVSQINRVPLIKPTLRINKEFDIVNSSIDEKIKFIENLASEDIVLDNYHCWPGIKMDMVA